EEAGVGEKVEEKGGWGGYQRERFGEAARVLLDQLKERPQGELAADATYLAGDCLFRQDRFTEARPLFERLIQSRDKKYLDRSLYRCGSCLAGLKEGGASQKGFEEVIRQFPMFPLLQGARYGL